MLILVLVVLDKNRVLGGLLQRGIGVIAVCVYASDVCASCQQLLPTLDNCYRVDNEADESRYDDCPVDPFEYRSKAVLGSSTLVVEAAARHTVVGCFTEGSIAATSIMEA